MPLAREPETSEKALNVKRIDSMPSAAVYTDGSHQRPALLYSTEGEEGKKYSISSNPHT